MKTDLGEYVLETNKVLDVFFDYWVQSILVDSETQK